MTMIYKYNTVLKTLLTEKTLEIYYRTEKFRKGRNHSVIYSVEMLRQNLKEFRLTEIASESSVW